MTSSGQTAASDAPNFRGESGPAPDAHPRLLLIDMTPMDGNAATSMLKRAYFDNWPAEKFSHLYASNSSDLTFQTTINGRNRILRSVSGRYDKLLSACKKFEPEVILYRPVADHPALHAAAMRILKSLQIPFAIWLMDDWPERLRRASMLAYDGLDRDLRFLLLESYANFAISDSMSRVFGQRYSAPFKTLRNGVRKNEWPEAPDRPSGGPVRVCYSGNLAEDMTLESVVDIAQSVSQLRAEGIDIIFEGRTQAHWRDKSEHRFQNLDGVSFLTSDMPAAEYRRWLQRSDITVVAYNFDDITRSYAQYSFANKTPELLASGTAILAYGPKDFETIKYFSDNGLALVVSERNHVMLRDVIRRLCLEPELRRQIGSASKAHAFTDFDLDAQRMSLTQALIEISSRWRPPLEICPIRCGASFDAAVFASNACRLQSAIAENSPTSGNLRHCIRNEAAAAQDNMSPDEVHDEKDRAAVIICQASVITGDYSQRAELAALQDAGYSLFWSEWRNRSDTGERAVWRRLAHGRYLSKSDFSYDLIAVSDRTRPALLDRAFVTALAANTPPYRGGRHLELIDEYENREQADKIQQGSTMTLLNDSAPFRENLAIREMLSFAGWSLRTMARRIVGFFGVFVVAIGGLLYAAFRWPEFSLLWLGAAIAAAAALAAYLAVTYLLERSVAAERTRRKEYDLLAGQLRDQRTKIQRDTNALIEEFKTKNSKDAELVKTASQTRLNEFRKILEKFEDEISDQKKEVLSSFEKEMSALLQKQERALHQSNRVFDSKLEELSAKTAELATLSEKQASDFNKLASSFYKTSVSNAMLARPHKRSLNEANINRFEAEWIKAFGLDFTRQQLGYLAHKISIAEDQAEGRLATPTETMLLRLLASHSLKGDAVDILEIGTLFGIGAACLYSLRAPHERKVHLTLLDPMEGYYGRSMRDPVTGVAICEDVLRRNLDALGVPHEAWRLIKHLSTAPEARKDAAQKHYDMLIIDGDHSIDGVARDYELYADLVKPGGLLIFDDYDTKDWPSIKPFVDDYVKPDHKWNWIGGEFRTGLFRRAIDV